MVVSPRTSVYAPTLLMQTRFAAAEDAQNIFWMITEPMAQTFRVETVEDLVYLIKNSVMAICQLDHQDAIVGFLAVNDRPLIPAVDPSAWEHYFWLKYKATELKARNTLFIHLMCWNPIYGRDVVDKLLHSVFMHDPYVHHIALLKMVNKYPLLVPGQTRAEISFRYVQAMEKGVPGDQMPILCVADRSEVCPRLRIRRAVEEDNDDLIPILHRHAPTLIKMYGEYYISELISRHPDSERVLLVCEDQGYAVGVIVLNTQINYEELEESFELSPFGGLKHSETKPLHKSFINPESTFNLLAKVKYNFVSLPELSKFGRVQDLEG